MDCGIPFCNNGCPLGQPHPRLERPRLPRPLARRDRAPARHQQLPRVHRPPVPGAVRGGLRARHQPGPGHDQAGRGRDHRPGLGRGLGHAGAARHAGPASGSRWSARARPGSPPPSSSPGPATTWCVFERADRIGGLLRYGIPEFKMEKRHLDRRLAQMGAEGTEFRAVGRRRRRRHRRPAAGRLRRDRAGRRGHRRPATCPIPGRELGGIHQAMEYLPIGEPGAAGRPAGADDHGRRASTS